MKGFPFRFSGETGFTGFEGLIGEIGFSGLSGSLIEVSIFASLAHPDIKTQITTNKMQSFLII